MIKRKISLHKLGPIWYSSVEYWYNGHCATSYDMWQGKIYYSIDCLWLAVKKAYL